MQIKVKNLTHVFDYRGDFEQVAINRANVEFNKNEFVGIIGHTGSGKTTLIEHLNGLLIPTFGEIEIISKEFLTIEDKKNKKEIGHLIINNKIKKIKFSNKLRKLVGIVFQFAEYQLFESTIEKDIIFGPINMGVPKNKAINLAKEYIKLVGLDESFLPRSPFDLSGGQKRRVALAGILAMEPEILVLDEPTAGLDPEGVEAMYIIFEKLSKQGKTIIIVTHNLDEMLRYAHRIILMNEGRIVKDGPTKDILYEYDLLLETDLEPPKLVKLVYDLENQKGFKIGKPKSIEEFANILKIKDKVKNV